MAEAIVLKAVEQRTVGTGVLPARGDQRELVLALAFATEVSGAEGPGAEPATEVATPFIDLGDLRSGGSRFEVRLELGGGVVLSIARG